MCILWLYEIKGLDIILHSYTLCCIFNIARELKRPVRWNPATLSFEGDKEAFAHRLYYYDYRRPYTLPYLERRG